MLTASVEKNRHGEWILGTKAHGNSFSHPIGEELWGAHRITGIKSEETTVGIDGEPFELLRIRTPEPMKPVNGIMILIEEWEHE